MTSTDRFLDLYKQLEYIGKTTYFPKSQDNENVIGRLINLPHLEKYKEDLNYCRVVRNFLTHNPRVGGSYPIEVSESMVAFLEKLLTFISNPPKAIAFAIKRKDMLVLHPDDLVISVIIDMKQNAYTHAPIINKGKLLGVFCDEIITMQLCSGGLYIDEKTPISYFHEHYILKNSNAQFFKFIAADAPISSVESVFRDNYKNDNLVSVVYLTENGKPSESILGMITPWDLFMEE